MSFNQKLCVVSFLQIINIPDLIKVKRALISASDKTGLMPLAKCLVELECKIISTGGTAEFLQENHNVITGISKITGNPEAFLIRFLTE